VNKLINSILHLKKILLLVLLLAPVQYLLAQPPPPPPPDATGAPIDGFAGILVMIIGSLLGKKFLDARRNSSKM
jgi:hypothetical protein